MKITTPKPSAKMPMLQLSVYGVTGIILYNHLSFGYKRKKRICL